MMPPITLAVLRHDLKNVAQTIACLTRQLEQLTSTDADTTRLRERLDRLTHLLADIAFELRRYA